MRRIRATNAGNILLLQLMGLVACLAVSYARADNQVTQIPFADSAPGSVGLGAGIRNGSSPYRYVDTVSSMENDNVRDMMPLYLYEGEYLFFHGTRAGVHLWDGWVTGDLVAQYRFDRLEPEVNDFYRTVSKRSQTVEGGLALEFNLDRQSLYFSLLSDLQSRHNGNVADLTYRYRWDYSRFEFSPYLSLIYQSQELVDYYYGVESDEARPDLPEYEADAAAFARLGLNTTYHLLDHWYLFANFSWEALPSEITDSPLVDEDQIYAAFVGFHYNFGNVFEPRSGQDHGQVITDWSWRVQAGYQAQGTFHKSHRGDLQRSVDVHTYLAGVTLGKKVYDGAILDFWGKFSINRRLENDLQDNFWDFSVYVMAMGTGYSPWSDRELFRYGFGFGFDYAQRIPMVEQIKQDKKDQNTSHFLNYLEAQVDFPLRNMTRAESVRNCYVGMTLIHRSGIFATSDILGNVSGGSDVVAAHMECVR
ncbi:MipA/OmpV family protein [Ketobacter sp.]|uniref:MipA/OmpV family protein n=1 Tax=Ketobacter sp. TaxID=2083498 RepID=UPI000F0F8CB5|nr:MipA/OmpV family protein [Ketobacter sp.]RLU01130.1 MAG: MipA/OmpV family protein [Ketobacter sp.]